MAFNGIDLFSSQSPGIAISVSIVSSTAVDMPGTGSVALIYNAGLVDAFFNISISGGAATVPTATVARTGMVIPPGCFASWGTPNNQDTTMVAATAPAVGSVYATPVPRKITTITATGSTTLYVYSGEGV